MISEVTAFAALTYYQVNHNTYDYPQRKVLLEAYNMKISDLGASYAKSYGLIVAELC